MTEKKPPQLQDVSILHLLIESKVILQLLLDQKLLTPEEHQKRYASAAKEIEVNINNLKKGTTNENHQA